MRRPYNDAQIYCVGIPVEKVLRYRRQKLPTSLRIGILGKSQHLACG